jgi:hypothetical protein
MKNKITSTTQKTAQTNKSLRHSGLFKTTSVIILLLTVFMWQCKKDDIKDLTRPTVTSTVSVSSATNVSISSVSTAKFSEAMDPLSITSATFTLKQGTTSVSGLVTYSDSVATFTPAAVLLVNSVYTATISNLVKDIAGNTMAINYVWSFTTTPALDITKPTVVSSLPVNNATGVTFNTKPVATFSEALDPLTVTALTFTLKQGTTAVSGAVTYTGSVATFTPAANFAASTVYTATVTTGAKDLAGNALASNYEWSFTTGVAPDITAPAVGSVLPLNNTTDIAINAKASATFNEALDPLTVTASTFTLKHGTTSVSGVVTYAGLVATFTPAANLAASTVYTATITTGAKDLAGNAIAANYVWSFTTGTTIAPLGVVNLGSAINYVILAKTAISNISISAITGDLGLSPAATSYITGLSLTNATGYATSAQVTGQLFAADMASPTGTNLTTAVEDMITAYNDAAGRLAPDFLELGTGAIGGMTLTPGLYKWTSAVTLLSDVTISGGANDVFIFQVAQDLTMANAKNLILTGGVQAKNIFWQVAGTVTIGTTSHFEGIILSMTGITFQTGASFKGRALAQTAVVLDGNTVIVP